MPILNWVGKEFVLNHDKKIPFRLLKKQKSKSLGNSENLVIEGDNLESLKAILPYYQNKIKSIFIDPPYNTGKENWVYNDNVNSPKMKQWLGKVVGDEDLTRHDKWLCMMYPRLTLLKDLLRSDGMLFVTIDDGECHYLKMILDEIFGRENFLINLIWQKKFSPQNDARFFSDLHDHVLVYSKNISECKMNLLERTELQDERYSNPDNDPRGNWASGDLSVKTYNKNYDFPIKNPSGKITYPPKSRCWRISKQGFDDLVSDNRIWFGKDGTNVPRLKRFLTEVKQGIVPGSLWMHEDVSHNQEARQTLKKIIPDSDGVFETPKPIKLIKRIIQLSTSKDDIVLDSFAGSGTTGNAVLELNKEDGGNRKFVLIEMESKICNDVTAQRLRNVIKGYSVAGKKIEKLDGGFQYCILDKPLFDENGKINSDCTFEDLASYIYFTETKTILDKKQIKKQQIGTYNETEYYLIFDTVGKNIFNKEFLKNLKSNQMKIIYADKCTISQEVLDQHKINFKQIPYEVRIF